MDNLVKFARGFNHPFLTEESQASLVHYLLPFSNSSEHLKAALRFWLKHELPKLQPTSIYPAPKGGDWIIGMKIAVTDSGLQNNA